MKILIAGSTGKTGLRLTRQLLEAGHQPIAMHRASSDTSDLPEGVAKREADLTDLSDDVCEGVDVVVFAAGSGGDTSAEMTDLVMLGITDSASNTLGADELEVYSFTTS